MIAMHPIDELDVISVINNARFDGDLMGYVVMDKQEYLGFALYRIDCETVEVLDTNLKENIYVDGAVRACIAAGQNKGCTHFSVNTQSDMLAKWHEVFCKTGISPFPIENIFELCK